MSLPTNDSPDTRPRLTRRRLHTLNACLLLAAAGLGLAHSASADQPGGARPPGSYLLIGGEINRGDSNGAYVIDTNSRDMILLRWQRGQRAFEGLGYRSFPVDLGINPGR